MNWAGIEGQWNQQEGEAMHNWGKLRNAGPAANLGKHEQLVENLQKKYGMAKIGNSFDEHIGDKIAHSIESLPNNFRTVVLLSDIEQLRYSEIAETLSCPVGTVCSRLHRGRKVLQQKLSNIAAVDSSLARNFGSTKYPQKESFK